MINNLLTRILSSIIIIPSAFFFILKGGYYLNFFLIICLILTLFEWNNMIIDSLKKNLGFIFIFFSFYSAYEFVILENNNENTIFNFTILVLICMYTDMGGYIFGKIFKGPKLTKISPNKTYAGVFGGFFCSTIFLYLTINLLNYFNSIVLNFNLKNFLLILFISLISQIGDLIVSYFKRLSNIKNTGNLIPGHGGILDRIDGMIFVFPVAFILN